MRRIAYIFVALLIVLLIGLYIPFNGQRVIGFRYATIVDNLDAVCPARVTNVQGSQITLHDGRMFRIEGPSPADLVGEMQRCDYRVWVDKQEHALHTAVQIPLDSSDRPQASQLLTIPLFRTELRQYTRHPFGGAILVAPASNRAQ